MTVPTSTAKSGPYAGAGTTGPFTVGFRFLENSHLQVIRTSTLGLDSTLALTTDYTVTGAGGASGTVTLVTALASGEKLTIIRDVPFTQEADYVQNDAFPAESHERALDKLTMEVQQVAEETGRALTLPATVSGVSTVLPTPEANKVIAWNPTANALQNLNVNEIASIVAYGTAASDIFTGTGSQTLFVLSSNPGALNNLDVAIGGVTQLPGIDYTWSSGTTVTFTTAPVLGAKVLIRYMQALALGTADAGSVQYTPAGTGAVETTVQTKLRESVSVKDFGAVGDGIADDTAEIQTAITSLSATGGVLFFPTGTYLVSAALNLVSNLTMEFAGGAKLKLNAGNTTEYVLRGATKDNLVFRDVVIEGSGLAGFSAVYLSSCNNVLFDNCKVTKAGSIGLSFISCTKVKVINCELSNNYFYGLEFRDCDACKAIGNDCYQNGSTGLATSAGGRGIMLWRSRYCYVAGNRMAANTEYGFRIYSEAADATTSNFNVITGNVFADNTVCDFVIYDEGAASSFTANNVISDNTVYRTTNATIGAVFTLQGDYNTFVNNHVYKSGAFGSGAAFNFFNANYCTISNSSANNIAVAFSTSSSANITIENCLGYNIANALTVPTANITIKNCKFIHGGGGGSDVAIINYATATGKNYYEGNIFQDFHTGIYIASEAVALFRNTSINSGFAGLRLTGNDFSLMECGGNSWDITQPYLLSAMTKTVSTYDQATTVFNIAPTTLTWGVGARVYNSAPAVGQPKSWVCTVAGTPGTWVSEGNL